MKEKKINDKVSVIIPAFNAEEFIEESLNSVFNQTYKKLEIIVINDGSTDNTLNILKEIKKKNLNLNILDIKNHGQGYGRNLAVTKATGDYILFVDADDIINPLTIETALMTIIKDKSDFVFFNWSRYDYKNKVELSVTEKSFIDKNILNENECLELLTMKPYYTVTNLYRKKFLLDNNIKYGEGYLYEDVIFWLKVASRANKVSILKDNFYRIRTNDVSVTQTSFNTTRHMDSFLQLLSDCEKYINDNPNNYDSFYNYIVTRFFLLYNLRIPKENKVEFRIRFLKQFDKFEITSMKNCSKYVKKFKKISKHINTNTFVAQQKIKFCTINRNFLLKIRGKTARIRKIIKKIIKSNIVEVMIKKVYIDKYINKKINNNQVLIESKNGQDLAGNMFYILKEINQNYKNYNIVLCLNKEKIKTIKNILNKYGLNPTIVKKFSKKYYYSIYTSKYLFTDSTFFRKYKKRKEQILINTWHGTALKKMGRYNYSEAFDIENVQKNLMLADYLVYPNKFMEEQFLDGYMFKSIYEGSILNVGYPRNTAFYNEDRKTLKEKLGLLNKVIYTYMPTWRENDEEFIDSFIRHIEELDEKLKDNQIVFLKLHLFMEGQINYNNYKHIKSFPKNIETYEFLNITDGLITDYSSIFFDYANTKKKIILFPIDEAKYLKDRGLYLDFKSLPFVKVNNVSELANEIDNPKFKEYDDFVNTYCTYDEKDATKRLCEFIFLNKNSITPKKIKKKKKNILVYLSEYNSMQKNVNYLKDIDYNKNNYYLLVPKKILKDNVALIKYFENKINYIPYGNLFPKTIIERIRIKIFKNKKNLSKILRNSIFQKFGNLKFDEVYVDEKKTIKNFKELTKNDIYLLSFYENGFLKNKEKMN